MSYSVQDVIDVANAEVGYCEKSAAAFSRYGKSCLYYKEQYAGSDNYSKYGYELHQLYPKVMDFPAYWCDAFVDWCFLQAYGVSNAQALIGGFDDYTKGSISLYKKQGAFKLRKECTPAKGMQVFFTKNESLSGVHHTALVVDVGDWKITTVEGNTSDGNNVVPNGGKVCRKTYAKDDVRIYGYGVPAYDQVFPYEPHWIYSNGKWYYRIGQNKNAHGWRVINHHKYYFAKDGVMQTGLIYIDEKPYVFAESGTYEGACCKTDEDAALYIWEVD